ncbi:MAG: bifunctional diguanylate cyclase/phosphodiesterase [Porticoccaceae bacterium]
MGADAYRRVVDSAPFGVLFFVHGVCVDANPMAHRLLGCEQWRLVGTALDGSEPAEPVALAAFKERLVTATAGGLNCIPWVLRAEGEIQHLRIDLGAPLPDCPHELVVTLSVQTPIRVAAPACAESRCAGAGVAVLPRQSPSRDAVLRKLGGADLLRSAAYRDGLTSLPTRLAMVEHLRAQRSGPTGCAALMLIDLDHFKDINDSWGHDVGDRILVKVARLLAHFAESLTATPGVFLARQAGDEFVLFIPNIGESVTEAATRARLLADALRERISIPNFHEGNEFVLTASIGISLIADATLDPERALQYADTAMYEAKRKGRNSCAFFDRGIAAKAQRQVSLNTRLRKAVDNQEFALFVQPLVDVNDGRMVGGEVLLRWVNSDRVTSMPAEFIPLLEASGLIVDVGHWVIRTACESLRGFIEAGLWTDDMHLGINISRRQFRDPRLLEVIEHSLRSYDISPSLINFEITETLAMEDVDGAIAKMMAIKSLGAHFAVDDFGVGYSSMIALRRLPFDWLKIDREFIRNLHRDPDARGIVEAMLAVSRQYGLRVIAEGVGDSAALDLLRQIGCDSYQGALYSMPVPVDRFRQLLGAAA